MSIGTVLRVLLVEDAPDDALLLRRELHRAGYEPATRRVTDLPSLAGALADGAWDLIVADVHVPGIEVLDVLRLVRRRGRGVPCIVVSGQAGEDEAAAALAAGAHGFVAKAQLAGLVPAFERERREAGRRATRRRVGRARRSPDP